MASRTFHNSILSTFQDLSFHASFPFSPIPHHQYTQWHHTLLLPTRPTHCREAEFQVFTWMDHAAVTSALGLFQLHPVLSLLFLFLLLSPWWFKPYQSYSGLLYLVFVMWIPRLLCLLTLLMVDCFLVCLHVYVLILFILLWDHLQSGLIVLPWK